MSIPLLIAGSVTGLILARLWKRKQEQSIPVTGVSNVMGITLAGKEQNPPASTIAWPVDNTWQKITIDDVDYLVAPTYIAPIGIGEAVQIAKTNNLVLPTPRMVDAIWNAADLKLEPHPQSHDGTLAMMNSKALADNQAEYIASQIGDQEYKLLGGTNKDVVFIDQAFGKQVNKPGIYGWHHTNGKVIQDPMWGHALEWKDYSQGLRLIKRA